MSASRSNSELETLLARLSMVVAEDQKATIKLIEQVSKMAKALADLEERMNVLARNSIHSIDNTD